ncbi:PAAR domain-containing protein [Massilia sp. CT11-137]|uniref:PAAR domain-containing protein n=1 Tax=Massilia sp. CT11-137 TaxID=3393901 RepID=UPI0039A572A4
MIRIDDKTDHGGQVISASSGTTVMCMVAALQDDMTQCPKCPKCKGNFAIKPGGAGARHEGKPYAYDGNVTECGARLMTSL